MPSLIPEPAIATEAPLSAAPRGDLCFMETQFPVSKMSKESYAEREAKQSQTLTGLGKWWGRKPLVLCRATILGLLLPATDSPEKDREVFLRLMTMDDDGMLRRKSKRLPAALVAQRRPACGERASLHRREEPQGAGRDRLPSFGHRQSPAGTLPQGVRRTDFSPSRHKNPKRKRERPFRRPPCGRTEVHPSNDRRNGRVRTFLSRRPRRVVHPRLDRIAGRVLRLPGSRVRAPAFLSLSYDERLTQGRPGRGPAGRRSATGMTMSSAALPAKCPGRQAS